MRLFALFNALVASVMVPVVASPIVNITATDDPQIAITHDSNHIYFCANENWEVPCATVPLDRTPSVCQWVSHLIIVQQTKSIILPAPPPGERFPYWNCRLSNTQSCVGETYDLMETRPKLGINFIIAGFYCRKIQD